MKKIINKRKAKYECRNIQDYFAFGLIIGVAMEKN